MREPIQMLDELFHPAQIARNHVAGFNWRDCLLSSHMANHSLEWCRIEPCPSGDGLAIEAEFPLPCEEQSCSARWDFQSWVSVSCTPHDGSGKKGAERKATCQTAVSSGPGVASVGEA